MSASPEVLIAALGAAGFRVSRARRAVVEALCGAGEPVTLGALLQRARHRDARVGLATVYRTVDVLVAAGVVRRMQFDGKSYVVACGDRTLHYHLVCEKCHRVEELHAPAADHALIQLAQRAGFALSDGPVELRGVCARCLA